MGALDIVQVFFLMLMWISSVFSFNAKTNISECGALLSSVRMEVSPTLLQIICSNASPTTLVIISGNNIWYERVDGFCSSFDLNTGQVLMKYYLSSTMITLQLVKSGRLLDSANVAVLPEQPLSQYKISAWGIRNTRLVLAISKECPPPENREVLSSPDGNSRQMFPGNSSQHPAFVHVRNTTSGSTFDLNENNSNFYSKNNEITLNPEYSLPNKLNKGQQNNTTSKAYAEYALTKMLNFNLDMNDSSTRKAPTNIETYRSKISKSALRKGAPYDDQSDLEDLEEYAMTTTPESLELAKLQWMEEKRLLFEQRMAILKNFYPENDDNTQGYTDNPSIEDAEERINNQEAPEDIPEISEAQKTNSKPFISKDALTHQEDVSAHIPLSASEKQTDNINSNIVKNRIERTENLSMLRNKEDLKDNKYKELSFRRLYNSDVSAKRNDRDKLKLIIALQPSNENKDRALKNIFLPTIFKQETTAPTIRTQETTVLTIHTQETTVPTIRTQETTVPTIRTPSTTKATIIRQATTVHSPDETSVTSKDFYSTKVALLAEIPKNQTPFQETKQNLSPPALLTRPLNQSKILVSSSRKTVKPDLAKSLPFKLPSATLVTSIPFDTATLKLAQTKKRLKTVSDPLSQVRFEHLLQNSQDLDHATDNIRSKPKQSKNFNELFLKLSSPVSTPTFTTVPNVKSTLLRHPHFSTNKVLQRITHSTTPTALSTGTSMPSLILTTKPNYFPRSTTSSLNTNLKDTFFSHIFKETKIDSYVSSIFKTKNLQTVFESAKQDVNVSSQESYFFSPDANISSTEASIKNINIQLTTLPETSRKLQSVTSSTLKPIYVVSRMEKPENRTISKISTTPRDVKHSTAVLNEELQSSIYMLTTTANFRTTTKTPSAQPEKSDILMWTNNTKSFGKNTVDDVTNLPTKILTTISQSGTIPQGRFENSNHFLSTTKNTLTITIKNSLDPKKVQPRISSSTSSLKTTTKSLNKLSELSNNVKGKIPVAKVNLQPPVSLQERQQEKSTNLLAKYIIQSTSRPMEESSNIKSQINSSTDNNNLEANISSYTNLISTVILSNPRLAVTKHEVTNLSSTNASLSTNRNLSTNVTLEPNNSSSRISLNGEDTNNTASTPKNLLLLHHVPFQINSSNIQSNLVQTKYVLTTFNKFVQDISESPSVPYRNYSIPLGQTTLAPQKEAHLTQTVQVSRTNAKIVINVRAVRASLEPSVSQIHSLSNQQIGSAAQASVLLKRNSHSNSHEEEDTASVSEEANQTSTNTVDISQVTEPIELSATHQTKPPGTTNLSVTAQVPGHTGTSEANDENPEEMDKDSFWPVVAGLVLGIPALVVLGIAITVIHRKRRADPLKLFNKKSLKNSRNASILTLQREVARHHRQHGAGTPRREPARPPRHGTVVYLSPDISYPRSVDV